MKKLNKPMVRKWIKALRSGDYYQTNGDLAKQRKDGEWGFCCLGVLCEVEKLDETEGFWPNTVGYKYGRSESDTNLPRKFQQEVGLTDWQQDELIEMNDSGKKFSTIAKKLETWIKE